MRQNIHWVYRKLSGYDILINIKTNKILTISPLLGELFHSPILTKDVFEKWKTDNGIADSVCEQIIHSLQAKGVLNE